MDGTSLFLVLDGAADLRVTPGDDLEVVTAYRKRDQPLALMGVFRLNGQLYDYSLPASFLEGFDQLMPKQGSVQQIRRHGRDLAIRLRRSC